MIQTRPSGDPEETGRLILGRDYLEPNAAVTVAMGPGCVGGIAPGKKQVLKEKWDGNEDAMAAISSGGHLALLVADSHFGAAAAEWAVTEFDSLFGEQGGSLAARLFKVHLILDDLLRERKLAESLYPGCATTLASAVIEGDILTFCGTGDSPLTLFRRGAPYSLLDLQDGVFLGNPVPLTEPARRELERLGCLDAMTNPAQFFEILAELAQIAAAHQNRLVREADVALAWHRLSGLFGAPFPLDPAKLATPWLPLFTILTRFLPAVGTQKLLPGDRLLLATDGLLEPASGCPAAKVAEILGQKLADERVLARQLLRACGGRDGGRDNLMFLLKTL